MMILEGFNMPPKSPGTERDWMCGACRVPLEQATVKLTYLDETFGADLPSCPSCRRVLVSEENAVHKMLPAEKMLEDK
jgi:ferredoxin